MYIFSVVRLIAFHWSAVKSDSWAIGWVSGVPSSCASGLTVDSMRSSSEEGPDIAQLASSQKYSVYVPRVLVFLNVLGKTIIRDQAFSGLPRLGEPW